MTEWHGKITVTHTQRVGKRLYCEVQIEGLMTIREFWLMPGRTGEPLPYPPLGVSVHDDALNLEISRVLRAAYYDAFADSVAVLLAR